MVSQARIHLGLVFGGRSCEHEVSLTSAKCIYQALDRKRYAVSLIGILKSGQWVLADESIFADENTVVDGDHWMPVALDHQKSRCLRHLAEDGIGSAVGDPLDMVFPVLHGPFGEDGIVQGLLELAGTAYVGSGVAGSAACMDKAIAKSICKAHAIPQTRYQAFRKTQWISKHQELMDAIVGSLRFPLFIKPANLGSSVGITKVHSRDALRTAIDFAYRFDTKIVVEEGLENCHEIEVAVLGNDAAAVSVLGEIIPGSEFYDYSDKYLNGVSESVIPAPLPDRVARTMQEYAKQAFLAVDAAGLARVDFLVNRDDYSIYLNEINTMPGFTPISMYPKLWQASGIGFTDLLDRLIELGLERHRLNSQKQFVL